MLQRVFNDNTKNLFSGIKTSVSGTKNLVWYEDFDLWYEDFVARPSILCNYYEENFVHYKFYFVSETKSSYK